MKNPVLQHLIAAMICQIQNHYWLTESQGNRGIIEFLGLTDMQITRRLSKSRFAETCDFKDGLPCLFHSFRNKYFNKISLGNMLYFQNKL